MSTSSRPAWLVPAGLATALLALLAGLLLGRGMASGTPAVDDPVSVGFADDMRAHHAQAVTMSAVVHARTDDEALRRLAFDIMTTQQGQIGIMTGWLDLWGRPRAGEPMSWMSGHDGPMPGMATREQLRELETLPPRRMEEQFLRLMVRHHRGALPMAAYAVEHAESADVVQLARGMEEGQASEIELMQAMLAERGLAPEPEDPAAGHGADHSGAADGDHGGAADADRGGAADGDHGGAADGDHAGH